jgi:hypothetical protein
MLIKDWVESLSIQSSKDQHRHTAAFRLNNAFQAIARDHLWSWLDDQFYFTTVPTHDVVATEVYAGVAGNALVSTGVGLGTVGREWTGAEVLITEGATLNGPSNPIHSKIVSIGLLSGAAPYNSDVLFLDAPIPESFTGANIKLFRREYVPRSGMPNMWEADRLLGKIRFRDMPNVTRSTTRPTLQYLTRSDYQINYGSAVESGSMVPQYYQMMSSRRVPSPKFPPVVTATSSVGAEPGVGGTYYLSCAYLDEASGIMSPLGPITQYEFNAAANNTIQIEYGRNTGVPEESYALRLYMSKANPVGLDGREITKTNRHNERMIPFYEVSTHPFSVVLGAGTKGGGVFAAVKLTDDFTSIRPAGVLTPEQPLRLYPQSGSQMVFLRELPDKAITFAVDGKLRMPWFCDMFDSPPVPDSFQELINLIMDANIDDSSGGNSVQKRGQYEFILRKLKGRDLKRARTSEVDPRHRGDIVPRLDRYGLSE